MMNQNTEYNHVISTTVDTKPNTNNNTFYNMISDIITSEDFHKMRKYKQHLHGNTYEHSVKVAYMCYRHYKKHPSKVDLKDLIRGALLTIISYITYMVRAKISML